MNDRSKDKQIDQIVDRLARLQEAKAEVLELIKEINTAVKIAETSLANLMMDNEVQAFKHKGIQFYLDGKSIIKMGQNNN